MNISKRADRIKPFIVMDILEEAQRLERNGESIIRLEIGEPDFPTPQCIMDAAGKALGQGITKYSTSAGIIELRDEIGTHYKKNYNVDITPEQIIVTSGTSPGLLLLFASLLESGDRVMLSDPYYACYPNFIQFFGGRLVYFPVREKEGFLYNPENIKKKLSSKVKAIVINSPSNPTGKTQPGNILKDIAQIGVPIISDEIYHGLTYGEKEHSILEYTDNAFVLNGFSKRYAMTGWRLGYIIVPKKFIRPIIKLNQNFFICANTFVQWAGVTALRDSAGDIEKMRQVYNQRRQFIVPRLREIGFKVNYEPDGAYYVLGNAKKYTKDSIQFANQILHEAKVAVTPGVDFGNVTEGYIRFSYANSLENIQIAMNRLEKFIQGIKKK